MIETIISLLMGKAGIALAALGSFAAVYFTGRKHEKTKQENKRLKQAAVEQGQINEIISDAHNAEPDGSMSNDEYNRNKKS